MNTVSHSRLLIVISILFSIHCFGQSSPELLNKKASSYLHSNIDSTIHFAEVALQLSKTQNNKLQEAQALLILGKANIEKELFKEAEEKFKNSKVIYENQNNFYGLSDNLIQLSYVNLLENQPDSAFKLFNKAIRMKVDIKDMQNLPISHKNFALLLSDNNDLENAEKFFLDGIRFLKESQESVSSEYYLSLSGFYEMQNKNKESLKYYKLYSSLRDSIYQNAKRNRAEKVETIKESEISKYKKLQTSLYLGLAALLLLVGFIYLFYINKQRANKTLSIQNKKILKQNNEIKKQALDLSKINKELEKLSIVASKTDNAIIITNPSGIIEWINDGYIRLYGFTLSELFTEKGNTYTEISSNPNIKDIFQQTITNKETQIYESDVTSRDGKKYRVQTTLTPILNDTKEVIKLIAIDSDVTKLKNTEDELQKLLFTKDRFFSIIAHDLKNPFNNIMGIAQLLVQGFERMKPEKIKYFHKGLYDISKNGYELLINLLEWARSQRGTILFEPIDLDLHKLCEETFQLYITRANQKEITLTNNIQPETIILADLNMLKTILRNLVSNALKFTDRGGSIELEAEIVDENIQVIVRDTGIGIEQSAASNLFKIDEYISTDGTENETGTGLGLILCKEFVDKHQGRIWVESKVGFGSKFNFTLPIKAPSPVNQI